MHDAPRDTGRQNIISRRRLELGMTQQQLADAVGVNMSYIRKLEGGKADVGDISLRIAIRIAAALIISAEVLFNDFEGQTIIGK